MIDTVVIRIVALALILLMAAMVGLCTSFLSWVEGATPVACTFRGAAATAATIGLGIAVLSFVIH